MLATLLIFAAEAGEESNKTPFYIAGLLAAIWAIALFVLGMRSPSFPGSAAAQRGVIAVSVVLVVVAMASSVLTA